MKITLGVVLAFALATVAPAARAQTQSLAQPAFDLEELTLDPAAVDSLVVVGGRTLPSGGLRLGLAVGYERDPLIVLANGSSVGALVSDKLTGDLVAAFGVTDRLEITADIPMILYQRGDDLAIYGLSPVDSAGMSNPLVAVRYGIVKGPAFNLAAGLGVGLPFGSEAALGGQGATGVSAEPQASVTWLPGPMLVAAELGVLLRDKTSLDVRNFGSELDAAASVEVAKSPWRPELIVHLVAPLTAAVPQGGEALLGARHDLGTPAVEAFALAGTGVGELPGLPIFRAMLGVAWRPDLAKQAPAPPPPEPVVAACPPAPECPKPVAAVASPAPVPAPIQDRDHDGVPDAEDQCPDEPGPPENLGCPVKDSDGDGVPDVVDNCPLVKGPAENHGCPVEKPQKVFIQRETASRIRSRIRLSVAINFGTDLATIDKDSSPILDQLAELLAAHPELQRLRVEGHTDNTGSDEHNRALSEARAKAVRSYLEKHGVKKGRLTSQGFGPSRPIDSNDTEAGRAHNRRVEIAEVEAGES